MRLHRVVSTVVALLAMSFATQANATAYRNFRVAIYVTVHDTQKLADPATFAREFARVSSQLQFDKVYIEAYRDRTLATDAQLETVKREFQSKGIQTSGGITLAAGGAGGQFGTFDYENPTDRAECERAVRLIARHFDEVILDDFFFYNSKSDADIAARGSRSWTDYRLAKMNEVSRDLVLGPAHQENPRVRVIIKYPNWYEHFHGLGFDLDQEAHAFDAIYTGTETRDPEITDQLLQQYESYEIFRYFSNIRPGANLGVWVDTYSIRSIDRYAEQLWDGLFAKAPEQTLFEWSAMASDKPAVAGSRPWSGQATSFTWSAIAAKQPNAGWATAANAALHIADGVIGQLGKPVGIASYRPPHASGEDFLHNYIGNLGVPIELKADYPTDAGTILLTEAAAADPSIIARIDDSLHKGANVIVTSGFLAAMQDRGFQQLAEWHTTGRAIALDRYFDGFGAGNGRELTGVRKPTPVLFPEIRFYTNDSWGIIRGVVAKKGFPVVLMNHYSKGTLYLWNMPENFGDLYTLPQPMITRIKQYLFGDAPVQIDAPDHVALLTYDNGSFIVQNFRDDAARVGITRKERSATESVAIPPHSFRLFAAH
ncbi:hypothetical protein [Sphingomonas sp.]|uniref:hypothetical protein n=1 Tax=Sphingomonas sp. TaxID=28214 RepID=UPI0026004AF6|nr:hypothetical protein [Sphingomonas sp.]MBV9528871.1 hypothetical protein [Sphingomonas sp.]